MTWNIIVMARPNPQDVPAIKPVAGANGGDVSQFCGYRFRRRGDLAYTVGYEHSAVSIDGCPVVRNDLRVTHIYRPEDGTRRLVHRHGGGGPHE